MSADFEGFAKAIMKNWPEGGVDGFEIQDLALAHGLIQLEPYDPDRHGPNEYDAEPQGVEWFVKTYAI